MRRHHLLPGLWLAALLLGPAAAQEPPPAVVVTIKPIHALAAAVMEGIAEPAVLLAGAEDEHSYALRPSDARALASADLVVWVGEGLEAFMVQPLATLAEDARVVEVMDLPGLTLLPRRAGEDGAAVEPAAAEPGHDADDHEAHDHGALDPHLWLDPGNAQVIVAALAETLAGIDPARADLYRANAERVRGRLEALDAELADRLAGVRDRPFVVFHDATQYAERRYGLNGLGAIAPAPEIQPGARHLAAMRDRVSAAGAVCIFAEPQFDPGLVDTLAESTGAARGTLDAIGAGLAPGPELYFTLMRTLADDLQGCLAGGG